MVARDVVDVWAQHVDERLLGQPWLESLRRWTAAPDTAPTLDQLLAEMDAREVDVALLSAWYGPHGPIVSNDEVVGFVQQAPDRFRGLAGFDLTDPVGAVRQVRRCVEELGFVGVRIIPWLWGLPPNDRRYYPVYVACVELGVPVCTQIGHTGPLLSSEPGRPIPYLEDVLLDLPDLTVVGGHVGEPWIREVLSLAMKFPNLYVDTSAYAVHRLPPELVRYLQGSGRSRVMFGSNWPMLSPARALERLDDLGLDDDIRQRFLGANARRVFGLDAPGD